MSERGRLRRDAITRARFFLEHAHSCRYSDEMAWQEPFEAYMEAAIIFGRIAIQRLKKSADRKAHGNPGMKDEKSVGVARQYTGTAGDTINCQVGTFLGAMQRSRVVLCTSLPDTN
ncbi:MAG TPA: hypothetical protein VFH16_00780 [Rubrobacter sp.]|jgi:hypothetical protein|nr:hypothetical protein [Rubrobacter sp.]